MIRFNNVRNLLVVVSALALGGCAAQASSSTDIGLSDDPLGRTELVAFDGTGSTIGAASGAINSP